MDLSAINGIVGEDVDAGLFSVSVDDDDADDAAGSR